MSKETKLENRRLLQIAEELHMNVIGSSDSLTEKEMNEYYEYISKRLENWDTSHYRETSSGLKMMTRLYDIRVKDLLHTTLWEYDAYQDERIQLKVWESLEEDNE